MPHYPTETVRALLATELVTEATRDALLERLLPPPAEPRFFTQPELRTLRAACARLLPQDDRPPAERIDVAAVIDARLAAGDSDGWRPAVLPPDADAYRAGLRWLDENPGGAFADQLPAAQDARLALAQQAPAGAGFAVGAWFAELLTEATEAYYSHPVAQEEIGYVGMADVPGWTRLGLGELEPREPEPLPPA